MSASLADFPTCPVSANFAPSFRLPACLHTSSISLLSSIVRDEKQEGEIPYLTHPPSEERFFHAHVSSPLQEELFSSAALSIGSLFLVIGAGPVLRYVRKTSGMKRGEYLLRISDQSTSDMRLTVSDTCLSSLWRRLVSAEACATSTIDLR